MTVDIGNENTSAHFSNRGWFILMSIARQFGWNPQGTVEPYWENEADAPEWNGGYSSNDGQRVRREDAAELAGALERALLDADGFAQAWEEATRSLRCLYARLDACANVIRQEDGSVVVDFSDLPTTKVEPETEKPLSPEERVEVFLGWGSNARELIDVCRGGDFRIW